MKKSKSFSTSLEQWEFKTAIFFVCFSMCMFGSSFHHAREARMENSRGEERHAAVTKVEERSIKEYYEK